MTYDKSWSENKKEITAEVQQYVDMAGTDIGICLWLQRQDIDHHMWLMDKIEVDDNGCWIWQGAYKKDSNRPVATLTALSASWQGIKAYRIAFAIEHGFDALPQYDHNADDPMELDHYWCSNKACVHPHHLEVVPQSINNARRFEVSA